MVNTRTSTATQNPEATANASDPLAAITTRLSVLDDLWDRVSVLEAQFSRRVKGKTRSHREADSEDGPKSNFRRRLPYTKLELPIFCSEDSRGLAPLESAPRAQTELIQSASREDPTRGQATPASTTMVTTQASSANPDATQYATDPFVAVPARLNTIAALFDNVAALKAATVRRGKGKVRSAVRIHKPQPVLRTSRLTLENEGESAANRGPRSSPSQPITRHGSTFTQAYSSHDAKGGTTSYGLVKASPISSSSYSVTTNAQQRPLANTERQRRRDKGLCFRCGYPFRHGHCCSATFSLMELDADGNPIPASLIPIVEAHPVPTSVEPVDDAHLEPPIPP